MLKNLGLRPPRSLHFSVCTNCFEPEEHIQNLIEQNAIYEKKKAKGTSMLCGDPQCYHINVD